MAVPFSRIASEALDNYGAKEAYDNLMQYDGVIAVMGSQGAIEFTTGGQPNFRERTLYGQNTNVGFRGKNAQVPTADDEGYTLISVPQVVIDGTVVWNQVEMDQIAGEAAIAPSLMKDKIKQYASTYVQVWANALRQATPAATDPYTILPGGTTGTVNGLLIARTPAQQTTDNATTGGISRGTNSWWQNQYSSTSYDLTQTSGRRGLHLDVYAPCTRGASKMFEPNFGLAGTVALSSLGAAADNNRRATYSDTGLMNLGFDNIMFYNAAIIRDSSDRFVGKIAFLNTRALKLKVLKGQGTVKKEMLDENNNLKSVPIFWKHQGQSDITSLNYVSLGYTVAGLVPLSLQDHGLADNVS